MKNLPRHVTGGVLLPTEWGCGEAVLGGEGELIGFLVRCWVHVGGGAGLTVAGEIGTDSVLWPSWLRD